MAEVKLYKLQNSGEVGNYTKLQNLGKVAKKIKTDVKFRITKLFYCKMSTLLHHIICLTWWFRLIEGL